MIKKVAILLIIIPLCYSCKESKKDSIIRMVNEWENKKIIFPREASFVSYAKSMKEHEICGSEYAIVTYVDSIGCMSCKLQLPRWKELIQTLDSVSNGKTSFLFFFHPKHKKELIDLIQAKDFTYPICIDEDDSFNKLNQLPSDMAFQTFLINKDNKVVAIGNPVHNPKIKELYSSIITGKKMSLDVGSKLLTTVVLSAYQLDMGTFDWGKEQCMEFLFTNSGNNAFVIENVSTSCGCITVEYSREPVQSGKSLSMKVKYKAEHPEHFNKTITVYSNAEENPFLLKITGNAK